MAVDHNSTITVNVTLAPSPPDRQGFSTVLLLVDEQPGNGLNGDRVVTYTDVDGATTDEAAGYITAATLQAVTDFFAQIPKPASIKVGRVDTVGAETYADGLSAVRAVDDDFYGIAIDKRSATEILSVSGAVETLEKLFVCQSADSDWLTTGFPAALSALEGRERTALIYHDTATEWADLCWLGSRLVYDPDNQSAGWSGQVREVADLATALTATQKAFLDGNDGNVGLAFSSADFYVSPGVNCNGRPIYEIVSADWFRARIREDFALEKLTLDSRGEKWVVDATGQGRGLAILNARLIQGEEVQHFVRGQTRATAEDITTADETARRLRFTAEAQIAGDAITFVINAYLQQTALQDA